MKPERNNSLSRMNRIIIMRRNKSKKPTRRKEITTANNKSKKWQRPAEVLVAILGRLLSILF
jgi:hypothetical protein